MSPSGVRLHRWDEIALEKVTEMVSRKCVTGERETLGVRGGESHYSPSGHILYTPTINQSGVLWALPFSLSSLKATGEAFPITENARWPSVAGDGTLAVVGSRSLPRMVSGLEEIGKEIDDGAIASWWAVAKQPLFRDAPDVLVIASRCGPDGQLGRLIGAIADAGYLLQTAASFPVNTGVSVYDYLLTFGGKSTRSSVEKVVARFSGTRLAGAFDKRGQEPKE